MFEAAIAAAAAASPMGTGSVPVIPGRLLAVDGDGLAYFCAGNDETDQSTARSRMIEKIQGAQRACGAEKVVILITAHGSHKGHRYAVARSKPYQGQRTNSRRPRNWAYLRSIMEGGSVHGHQVRASFNAEADDLFAYLSKNYKKGDLVIYTQDKDMRMVPGTHLDWNSHRMFMLPPGVWRAEFADKTYGRAWFWQQILQGDSADNIPGLPRYCARPTVFKPMGEVTAVKALSGCESDMGALLTVSALYMGNYGDRWVVELLEQAILLWMRDNPEDPFNVADDGNPLAALRTHEFYASARAEIQQRIDNASIHATTEDDGSEGVPPQPAAQAVDAVRPVQPTVCGGGSGPGPRPLDGGDSGCAAPSVQCVAGQGGEQRGPVRSQEPVGVSERVRSILAAARRASTAAAPPDPQD